MSENCDVIVIFPIYGQFSVIRKPNSGCIAYKTYINLPFISQKLKVELNLALTLLLWVKVLFADVLQKNSIISKTKRVFIPKSSPRLGLVPVPNY